MSFVLAIVARRAHPLRTRRFTTSAVSKAKWLPKLTSIKGEKPVLESGEHGRKITAIKAKKPSWRNLHSPQRHIPATPLPIPPAPPSQPPPPSPPSPPLPRSFSAPNVGLSLASSAFTDHFHPSYDRAIRLLKEHSAKTKDLVLLNEKSADMAQWLRPSRRPSIIPRPSQHPTFHDPTYIWFPSDRWGQSAYGVPLRLLLPSHPTGPRPLDTRRLNGAVTPAHKRHFKLVWELEKLGMELVGKEVVVKPRGSQVGGSARASPVESVAAPAPPEDSGTGYRGGKGLTDEASLYMPWDRQRR